ncbi:molybdopterin converting factor subunit 1 [Sedimenticola hydrogenitrophicus]|uniref:molybdopterin converting factor subunit 1 n=1 Tax=Sedimenticola hydrogenitrophicus TaxID=2967975 RepID=UPI0021A3301E|nr:molybdopterin converting factor subunit 1 [Sedimenticola hydrogenitrophicus]
MINLLYFARLREALQTGSETLDYRADLATVAAIVDLLKARGGVWGEVFADDQTVLVAVNQEMCDLSTVVTDGDEVAFFPPVTGG